MRFNRIALIALAATLLIGGCGKSTTPTSLNTSPETPSLDTAPPETPSGLVFISDDSNSSGALRWNASSAPDVAGYDVFLYSPDPSRDGAYVYLTTVEPGLTDYSIDPSGSLTTRFYRVRAVDSSGNRSGFTSALSVELWPASSGSPSDGSPLGHMNP